MRRFNSAMAGAFVRVSFRRVVLVHERHRDAGVLLHEIADRLRLVGGQQRAQKTEGEVVHTVKVAILKRKDKNYQWNGQDISRRVRPEKSNSKNSRRHRQKWRRIF